MFSRIHFKLCQGILLLPLSKFLTGTLTSIRHVSGRMSASSSRFRRIIITVFVTAIVGLNKLESTTKQMRSNAELENCTRGLFRQLVRLEQTRSQYSNVHPLIGVHAQIPYVHLRVIGGMVGSAFKARSGRCHGRQGRLESEGEHQSIRNSIRELRGRLSNDKCNKKSWFSPLSLQ